MPPKGANPYQAGPSVGRKPSFVGRRDLIRDALAVLERPEGRALVLYGQRRIGKTSILHQLEDGLRKTRRYLPVFVDMQEYADGKSVSLFADLAQRIARAAELEEPTTIGNSPDQFYTWMQGVLPHLGRGLVLLLDEFDVLAAPATTKSAEQRSSLFPDLRTVLERLQPEVGCIFVIGRNINDLSATALSLFKGTEARQVSLLHREDFRALLALSQGLLQWTPEVEELVWQLSSGHPLMSQMVASKLWERGEPVSPAVVAAVLPKVLEASAIHLTWLWQGLGPAPRVVASALASLGPGFHSIDAVNDALLKSGVAVLIGEIRQAPQLLKSWDLVDVDGESCRFRVELLRRWIVENYPLRVVQEELDRIEPKAEKFFALALDQWRDGEIKDARENLEKALRLNPSHARAAELFAEILITGGELERAAAVLEELHKNRPEDARPRLTQVLLLQAEAASEADKLNLYRKILEISPGQVQAGKGLQQILRGQAEAAEKEGFWPRALGLFEEAGLEVEVARLRRLVAEEEARQRRLKEEAEIRAEVWAIRAMMGKDPVAAEQQVREAARRWRSFPSEELRIELEQLAQIAALWRELKLEKLTPMDALVLCGRLLALTPGDVRVYEHIDMLTGRYLAFETRPTQVNIRETDLSEPAIVPTRQIEELEARLRGEREEIAAERKKLRAQSPGNGLLGCVVWVMCGLLGAVMGYFLGERRAGGESNAEPVTIAATPVSSGVAPSPTSASTPAATPFQTRTGAISFLPIPVGSFNMGSPEGTGDADEYPEHRVELSAFVIGKTEVTQAQWRAVVRAAKSAGDDDARDLKEAPSNFKGDDLPVEQVNWCEAARFANALSRLEGREPAYTVGADCEDKGTAVWKPGTNGFRLPTEAEWEYAARGGTAGIYAGGDEPGELAWYDANSGNTPHAVCGKKANGYGLCDMSGNVWEWVWDWYGDYPPGMQPDPQGPQSGSSRASRGGGWYDSAARVRMANRNEWRPGYDHGYIGFRLSGPSTGP